MILWWKLFHAATKNWYYILILVGLLFCFPMSNEQLGVCLQH